MFRRDCVGFDVSIQNECVAFTNGHMSEPTTVAKTATRGSTVGRAKLLGDVGMPCLAVRSIAFKLTLNNVGTEFLTLGASTLGPTLFVTFVSGIPVSAGGIASRARALVLLLIGASSRPFPRTCG